jgi:peroxiredoxin
MKPLQIPQSPDIARRGALVAMLAAATAGAGCSRREPAPAFGYTLLDGGRAHSEALRGKVLLINFWATSCAICVKEMPAIAATHRKFASRGFEILAVALSTDPPALVSSFAQSRQLPFGVVIDNTGAIARVFGKVEVTPTFYLIDKRGSVARRYVGAPDFADLHARVETLLAET